ncbi:anhydro-N-acetylmuramic acid kinase, partial [Thalassolituus sp. UBA2590]|uniref:anhydro-N-acetylmuramic acid kinase n=1 Tax=Thalassolituus sp. UBA2590 TaxID=1947663 RepID=UPI0026484B40
RRDIAAGGEGAPLVPAFHQVAMQAHQPCGVLNIGGIANLTLVNPDPNKTLGFDTGPGNALMDEYCKAMTGCSCDAEGTSAARGTIISELLEQWLQHPYFSEEPPKSTGRELFNLKQLQIPEQYPADNVLATLAELTATSISSAIKRYAPELQDLYVCGGGLKNSHLMNRIRANLPQMNVQSTEAAGVHPDWMEAIAFAWLGWRTLNHLSGNLPAVTGAQGERILGGIYPAGAGENNQK